MSWLFISTTLDKLRQLRVSEEKRSIWKKRLLWLLALSSLGVIFTHLIVRFYFWPLVEKNKSEFEKVLSQNLGAELRIEEIKTDWEFLWPAFKIKNITIHRSQQSNEPPLLSIPEITGNLSWESLWELQPHFHDLKFENARIHAKRDIHGDWDIAGIKLAKNSAGFKAGNWIFDQDSMQANNAEIVWLDQQNQSTEHHIQIDSLNLKNTWFKHQISLVLRTPWNEGVAKVDAQFRHNLLGDAGNWRDWNGSIDWSALNLDLRKINATIGSDIKIVDGFLNSAGKTYLSSGMLDGGTTDLQFKNLHFEWARIGQPLKIMSLEAQIVQETYGNKISMTAPKLNWQIDSKSEKQELNDISFYWKAAPNINLVSQAGIKAPSINIELVEQLAKQFPLPKDIQQFINDYQPTGHLENLDANWHAEASRLPFRISIPGFNESNYKVSFDFNHLFLKPVNTNNLGLSNFSGKIFATELGGEVSINNEKSSAVLPQILENDQLDFNKATGVIKWVKNDDAWDYALKNIAIENDDVSLQFDAAYQPRTKNRQEYLSINGNIESAKVFNLTRYFPAAMSKDARDYIRGALKSGFVKNGTLKISGQPQHIPFSANHPGTFNLNLPVVDVEFHPASASIFGQGQWSPFSKVNGIVKLQGPQLNVDFNEALFESVQLSNVHGKVLDVTSKNALLEINGHAAGHSQDLLNYYLLSPSGQNLKSSFDGISISGQSNLKIDIALPLANTNKTTIKGELNLQNNIVNLDKKLDITHITGDILFSEENISSRNLKAKALGGEILISNASSLPWSEQPLMKVKGSVQVDQLLTALTPQDTNNSIKTIYNQVNGPIVFDGDLLISSSGYKLNLGLQLKQFSSALPAPFNKKTGATLNGNFYLSNINKDSNSKHIGAIKIGKLIEAPFDIDTNNNLRANLGVNTVGKIPESGMSANIKLDQLDIDEWDKWVTKYLPSNTSSKKNKSAAPVLRSLTADLKKVQLSKKEFNNVNLTASYINNLWQGQIDSPFATGLLTWQAAQPDIPYGKLTARLRKLTFEKNPSTEPGKKTINSRAERIPAMDITAENLTYNNHDYGALQLIAKNNRSDWLIEKLSLKNENASVLASGRWQLPQEGKNAGNTFINFDLDIDDGGKLLDKLGFPKTIDSGSGKLVGNLNWEGAPHQFDVQSLQADISLDLAKGTILQVDPGVARLLGVLSYQGLTRLATLDIGGVLKPMVTQGTPFDRITSQGKVLNGIANIKDLSIKGPQGNVRLTGNANLVNETQDMRITVVPNLNAGSASVAYTFVNPIIGLSTLIGQYLIADEVSKLFQLDYLVQGTWAAPQVIPLDNKGRPLDANALKEIRDKSLLRQQQNPNKK
ncbi:TIGR02099 family protein [Polynucleobacter sp. 30F-ANTBAC]|uniref:YhdP family protein n=1 Tax=Polynucleobacter sp. 30F-ANTBAC TaxID=2689095 RepID=UPI001C0BA757|nr:YhdP family protein [Polynucleobacter sp. 30F-ANTBAC]MBU3600312.1 TIGR02099 family protein [Polynucleobacter sp. 30F-ANTBAC]